MEWNLDNLLLVGIPVIDAILIGVLLYRRTWRSLPTFLVYCVWDLISNTVLSFIERNNPAIAFHVYFAQNIVDSILIFCVLVNVAWSVLRPVRASLSNGALVLVGFLILLAGAAIWPFAALPGLAHATTREGMLFVQLQQTTIILRILFFLILAGGSQLLSIGWRDRELQVATGFGFYSLVCLTGAVLDLHQTSAAQFHRLDLIILASYPCCLIYWVFSFAQQEAERREFTPQMQRVLLAVAGAARATRVGIGDSQSGDSGKSTRR